MPLWSSWVTVVVSVAGAVAAAKEYPECGDCWCVPSHNGSGLCPLWEPKTEFSSSVIQAYKGQIPKQIYTLNCNPYNDANCTTTPPQVMLDNDSAVCAYKYESESCETYSMVTYANRLEALENGAVVTHTGSCGVCSTTQDLALYLSNRLCILYLL